VDQSPTLAAASVVALAAEEAVFLAAVPVALALLLAGADFLATFRLVLLAVDFVA
jgi:hypothetical protein